mmetsp:Transcript_59095/g.96450  ORF Transcript_59095/g.96450 Transcript_59095/m.96450 type:complete len:316 (+) Transcript_59095:68-1015(+)
MACLDARLPTTADVAAPVGPRTIGSISRGVVPEPASQKRDSIRYETYDNGLAFLLFPWLLSLIVWPFFVLMVWVSIASGTLAHWMTAVFMVIYCACLLADWFILSRDNDAGKFEELILRIQSTNEAIGRFKYSLESIGPDFGPYTKRKVGQQIRFRCTDATLFPPAPVSGNVFTNVTLEHSFIFTAVAKSQFEECCKTFFAEQRAIPSGVNDSAERHCGSRHLVLTPQLANGILIRFANTSQFPWYLQSETRLLLKFLGLWCVLGTLTYCHTVEMPLTITKSIEELIDTPPEKYDTGRMYIDGGSPNNRFPCKVP